MTDAKIEKIWTSAPDMDMLPEQIETLATDLGFSVDECVLYLRQVSKQALGGKIVSHMMNNNQMFFLSGFREEHTSSEIVELAGLYEYPQDMLNVLMQDDGIIDVYQGVRGKNIITVTNKQYRWTYEVYRVKTGGNEIVKKWLYNTPEGEDAVMSTVRKLMMTSEYRRNGWLTEVLSTKNVYGNVEV